MSKPRVADVRLVSSLLERDDFASADELAAQIITDLDAARTERAKRERHLGLLLKAADVLLAVGPFQTDKAMGRWCKQNDVNPDDTTTVVIKRPEEV